GERGGGLRALGPALRRHPSARRGTLPLAPRRERVQPDRRGNRGFPPVGSPWDRAPPNAANLHDLPRNGQFRDVSRCAATIRNQVYPRGYRGFESHSLRNDFADFWAHLNFSFVLVFPCTGYFVGPPQDH